MSAQKIFSVLRAFACLFAAAYSIHSIQATSQAAIFSGAETNNALLGVIETNGQIISIPIGTSSSSITGVALNSSGLGIYGGYSSTNVPIAGYVQNGVNSPISFGSSSFNIYGVAINSSGNGLLGGDNTSTFAPYLALCAPNGAITPITPPSLSTGNIQAVALNDSNLGLAIGNIHTGGYPYACFINPNQTTQLITFPGYTTSQLTLTTAALNNNGQAMISGFVGVAPPLAVLTVLNTGGTAAISVTLPTPPGGQGTFIGSGSLNNAGLGIVGGNDGGNSLLGYVSIANATFSTITLGGASNDIDIFSVSINDQGWALAGGTNTSTGTYIPYAALIAPGGIVQTLSINFPIGEITAVSINPYNYGLIAGYETISTGSYNTTNETYIALVSPTGTVTPFSFSPIGSITAVSFTQNFSQAVNALSNIPTGSVAGNNLIFANYINQYAPQNSFYFIPSIFNGTLNNALESTAPTRNGISLYTEINNLFLFSTTLSTYMRKQPLNPQQNSSNFASSRETQLIASLDNPKSDNTSSKSNKKQTFWGEAIGAFAYQEAQNQTPAFNPSTGGFILGYDYQILSNLLVGAGFSYLYTHIDEKNNAGFSNINQEDFFLYGTWEKSIFYVDGSLWGGMFQTHQVRNIQMTSFSFQSKSNPKGGNLVPHLELGVNWEKQKPIRNVFINYNPFFMADWANAWQGRYTETGSGPFNITQNSHYSSLLRLETGLRLYETYHCKSWKLIFQEKGSYVRTQSFNAGQVTAFLVGAGGLFTVDTLNATQNLGVFQFMATLEPLNTKYPSMSTFYQGEFGSGYFSNQINLGVTWSF